MRIAVYAIALNEARHAVRFMRSCRDADVVVVGDTGSTDGTPELLRAEGALVYPISISPWRFDDARNAVLALVPAGIDACISLDLDEILLPDWRIQLDQDWPEGTNRWWHDLACYLKPDGSADLIFRASRIHARHGFRWRHACHELPVPDRVTEVHAGAGDLRIDHLPDETKSRAQYLPLLEHTVAEAPDDSRPAFYLGREYMNLGHWARAEATLKRYLSLPGGDWPPEASAAMIWIGGCRGHMGDPAGERAWLRRACEVAPDRREPFVLLAEACERAGDWPGCRDAAEHALSIRRGAGMLVDDARMWGDVPAGPLARANARLGPDTAAKRASSQRG